VKFHDVCDHCGTVFATVEMDGSPYVIEEWLRRTESAPKMCPKFCGGYVRKVKEGDRGQSRRASAGSGSPRSWLSRLLGS
jgi:hypothetical protein